MIRGERLEDPFCCAVCKNVMNHDGAFSVPFVGIV